MKIKKRILFKNKILTSISQRKKCKFECKDIFYLIICTPFYNLKWKKKSTKNKRINLYNWGKQKLKNELDIYNIINSIRKANLIASVLLNKHQQILWRHQSSTLLSWEFCSDSNQIISKRGNHSIKDESLKADLDELAKLPILIDNDISQKLANGVI